MDSNFERNKPEDTPSRSEQDRCNQGDEAENFLAQHVADLLFAHRGQPGKTKGVRLPDSTESAISSTTTEFTSTCDQANWKTTISKDAGKEIIVHDKNGTIVEQWQITRSDRAEILGLSPMLASDPRPDPHGLSESRKDLFKLIEQKYSNPLDRLQIAQAMQQLEQAARDGQLGSQLPWVRAHVSATYNHALDVLKDHQNCSIDLMLRLLQKESPVTASHHYDAAGMYANGGQLDKEQEKLERREPEIWQSSITRIAGKSDCAIVSCHLNGKPIESWSVTKHQGRVVEVSPIKHVDPMVDDKADLKEYRRALVAAIENSNLNDTERVEFYKDMMHLEHRARCGEMGVVLKDVRSELANTYKHLRQLIETPAGLPAEKRLTIARQLAHQLADTQDIDQGQASDACRMSAVECRLSVRRPSLVSELVASVALTGTAVIGNPAQKIDLDQRSLRPASSQCLKVPCAENERSYASQLFQLTVMNFLGKDPIVCREHHFYLEQPLNAPLVPSLRFEQGAEEREADGTLKKRKNGLQVYASLGNRELCLTKWNKESDGTNQILLQAYQAQRILDALDPGKHDGVVIAHKDLTLYVREQLFEQDHSQGKIRLFDDKDGLESMLKNAKLKGSFPLIIATRDERPAPESDKPVKVESNEGNHSITIRDYIPAKNGPDGKVIEPARIVTDDQFGKKDDRRRMNIDELWTLTAPKR
jgi:hypothetical protein